MGEATVLQCLGGFVVTQCYGLARPTADFDVLWSVTPREMSAKLVEIAGQGSAFSKKYRMYVDVVTVAELHMNTNRG